MHKVSIATLILVIAVAGFSASASEKLLEAHCFECHNDEKTKGKFDLAYLGDGPTAESLDHWLDCLDMVSFEDMPPEDESVITSEERAILVTYLEGKLDAYNKKKAAVFQAPPRRLNNREFENSVRDVLLIERVGTHDPLSNLIADTLHHGFDTHGETLGFSRFHLEQYLEAVRKVIDATILSGEKPEMRRYEIPVEKMQRHRVRQGMVRQIIQSENGIFDFRDPKDWVSFVDFPEAPETGFYRIKIRCTGKDRLVYDSEETGFYEDDPIQLRVHLGNVTKTFDLPDEEEKVVEIEEWLAKGTRLRLQNPTDAFRFRSNGNFKFQYGIAPDYLKKNEPEYYQKILKLIAKTEGKKRVVEMNRKNPDRWQNWVTYWQGARPRLFGAEVEGPFFENWPPKRQVKLLGEDPKIENAEEILRPIAERAWRRPVRKGELAPHVRLAMEYAEEAGDIEGLKEGIVSILVSPSFLLLNTDDVDSLDRFASKISYFLHSSLPNEKLISSIRSGKLNGFDNVNALLSREFLGERADDFLNEFPNAWMELDSINFMAPDPDQYPFYHRKSVSEDMAAEARMFFRHVVENNLPITEFLSADYSFINADLARIYGVEGVPQDSILRKYTFTDGRRGGLLGMGAFLTATADSLGTSPIHRAIYVMENFLGIHPKPPPGDVKVEEPDVRQAKTIKEILAAHMNDPICASCHEGIDPFGYAFENFDPTGAWRTHYVAPMELDPEVENEPARKKRKNSVNTVEIPIDASARFRNGAKYQDIKGYRKRLMSKGNQERFVRCFVKKVLLYANGVEPRDADFAEIEAIMKKSVTNDYRIVDTLAAVIDSPLFRGEVSAR